MTTVLLVEDNVFTARAMRRVLTWGGIAVVEASTAKQALGILDAGVSIDLVLTDIVMPEDDGVWLLGELRRRTVALPVVALTGLGEDERVAGAGFDAVVEKPVNGDALVRLIQVIVRRHEAPQP